MFKLFGWLGNFFASLSVLLLLKRGFDTRSFAAPIQIAADYYERAIQFLLSWMEPSIAAASHRLLAWTGWTIRLQPQWRHFFVLLFLYVAADTLANWHFGITIEGKRWRPRRKLAAWLALLGTATSLLFATAGGLIDPANPASALLLTATGLAALVSYEALFNALGATFLRSANTTWAVAFIGHLQPTLELLATSLAVLVACLLLGALGLLSRAPSPGLVVLFVAIISVALHRIFVGVRWTSKHRELAARWRDVFELSISGPFGLRILKAFGGALLFVITSAGLNL